MWKTYRYRLYPSKKQIVELNDQLSEACRLYNAALQERRDAYRTGCKSLNYYTQANQLKEIRDAGDLSLLNFSTCQNVIRRVDRSFRSFFARCKRGSGKAGFPRFKSRDRYNSYTFPSYGDGIRLLDTGKLRVQGIGLIKVKMHRSVSGRIKTITIKREADRWYACFLVEYEAQPLATSAEVVGVDVGLTTFATLSDGTEIDNPRYGRAAERRMRVAQRKVARRRRRSNRRRKAARELEILHAHVRSQRADFHHKASRHIVNNYGLIAVEDLNVKGLASGMLAKSVHDAGWSAFLGMLAYKAENAGRVFVKVDPRGTSQMCPCGAAVPKTLSQRWHECSACGLSLGRDHVSALLILRLGLSLQAGRWPRLLEKPAVSADGVVTFNPRLIGRRSDL